MRTPRLFALCLSVFTTGLVLGGTTGVGAADGGEGRAPVEPAVLYPVELRSTGTLQPAGVPTADEDVLRPGSGLCGAERRGDGQG